MNETLETIAASTTLPRSGGDIPIELRIPGIENYQTDLKSAMLHMKLRILHADGINFHPLLKDIEFAFVSSCQNCFLRDIQIPFLFRNETG